MVFWAHGDVAILPVTLAKDGRLQMAAMVGGHGINVELDTSSANTVMRRDVAELYVRLKPEPDMSRPMGPRRRPPYEGLCPRFPELIFAGGSVTGDERARTVQNYSMSPAIYRDLIPICRYCRRRPAIGPERIPDLTIGMDVLTVLHMYVVPGQAKVYVTAANEEYSPDH